MGARALQGPHHVAVKSTSTGTSLFVDLDLEIFLVEALRHSSTAMLRAAVLERTSSRTLLPAGRGCKAEATPAPTGTAHAPGEGRGDEAADRSASHGDALSGKSRLTSCRMKLQRH